MVIVYFPFLGLYSLAYIRPHLVHVIDSFIIYKDSSLSSWYQSAKISQNAPGQIFGQQSTVNKLMWHGQRLTWCSQRGKVAGRAQATGDGRGQRVELGADVVLM